MNREQHRKAAMAALDGAETHSQPMKDYYLEVARIQALLALSAPPSPEEGLDNLRHAVRTEQARGHR